MSISVNRRATDRIAAAALDPAPHPPRRLAASVDRDGRRARAGRIVADCGCARVCGRAGGDRSMAGLWTMWRRAAAEWRRPAYDTRIVAAPASA